MKNKYNHHLNDELWAQYDKIQLLKTLSNDEETTKELESNEEELEELFQDSYLKITDKFTKYSMLYLIKDKDITTSLELLKQFEKLELVNGKHKTIGGYNLTDLLLALHSNRYAVDQGDQEYNDLLTTVKEIFANKDNHKIALKLGMTQEDIAFLSFDKDYIKNLYSNTNESNIFIFGNINRCMGLGAQVHATSEDSYQSEYYQFLSSLHINIPEVNLFTTPTLLSTEKFEYINPEALTNNAALIINYPGDLTYNSNSINTEIFSPAKAVFRDIAVYGNGNEYIFDNNVTKFINEEVIKYSSKDMIFVYLRMHGASDGSNFQKIITNLPNKLYPNMNVVYYLDSCHSEHAHQWFDDSKGIFITNSAKVGVASSTDTNHKALFDHIAKAANPIEGIVDYFHNYKSTCSFNQEVVFVSGKLQDKEYHHALIEDIYNEFNNIPVTILDRGGMKIRIYEDMEKQLARMVDFVAWEGEVKVLRPGNTDWVTYKVVVDSNTGRQILASVDDNINRLDNFQENMQENMIELPLLAVENSNDNVEYFNS